MSNLNRGLIRALDLSIAITGLVVLSPVMAVIAAIAWLENRSPIFRQVRLGRDEREFTLLKFRTMRIGTPATASHLADPNAITRFGRVLRTYKLDELPQLVNVLRGDMSIVGPRPGLPSQDDLRLARSRHGVFRARPGITGLAQVSGIDMSTPELLAKTDSRMLHELNVRSYGAIVVATVRGSGSGDAMVRSTVPAVEETAQRKRVVLVAHQYHPAIGPAAFRLGLLVEELARWAEVRVLTTSFSGRRSTLLGASGEQITCVRARDSTGQSPARVLRLIRFAVSIAREFPARAGKVDAVIADPPPTAALAAYACARLHRAPFIYYFCDSWAGVASRGGLAGRLSTAIRVLENFVLKRADMVVAAEESLASEAVTRGARRVELVANGADIEKIRQIDAPTEPPRVPYFVYAGTHSEVHGARIFVEAAKLLWDRGERFELLFFGNGTDAEWIVDQSRHHEMLHWSGPVPLEDLVPRMRSAAGSLVSLGEVPEDYYATPSKIYNSLAAGCPVVYVGPRRPVGFLLEYGVGSVSPRDVETVAARMTERLRALPDDAGELELRTRARTYAIDERDFRRNMRRASRLVARCVSEAGLTELGSE